MFVKPMPLNQRSRFGQRQRTLKRFRLCYEFYLSFESLNLLSLRGLC
jgi:hypothetical protein